MIYHANTGIYQDIPRYTFCLVSYTLTVAWKLILSISGHIGIYLYIAVWHTYIIVNTSIHLYTVIIYQYKMVFTSMCMVYHAMNMDCRWQEICYGITRDILFYRFHPDTCYSIAPTVLRRSQKPCGQLSRGKYWALRNSSYNPPYRIMYSILRLDALKCLTSPPFSGKLGNILLSSVSGCFILFTFYF